MARKPGGPRISIIVATYNRSGLLAGTLDSLCAMSLDKRDWEAIVVNNNSTDDTERVFKDYLDAHPDAGNIRMVFEARQGLSHARNRGISESRGEIIAVIDDDELVNGEFAGAYLDFFYSRPDAAAAGGKITPMYMSEKPRWISRYTEIPIAGTLDLGDRVREFPRGKNPFGGNMALRRTTLERTGLFDPAYGRTGQELLAGEEKELFLRIRQASGKVYWVPGPEIFHIIDGDRLTRAYFERLNYMGGVSERRRTLSRSRTAYLSRLASEAVKWMASLVLATGFCLSGETAKARYLLIMRRSITRGLFGGKRKKAV